MHLDHWLYSVLWRGESQWDTTEFPDPLKSGIIGYKGHCRLQRSVSRQIVRHFCNAPTVDKFQFGAIKKGAMIRILMTGAQVGEFVPMSARFVLPTQNGFAEALPWPYMPMDGHCDHTGRST